MEARFLRDTGNEEIAVPVSISWAIPAVFVLGGLTCVLVK
jgi:hypothetical protein